MKILISIIILVTTVNSYTQVSGLSAGKLTVPSASILDKNTFEFEPAFSVTNSGYLFDGTGKSNAMGEHNISSSFDFRLTAGLTDNFEMGTSISSRIEEIIFGAKYRLVKNNDLGFAVTGGISLPAGNRTVADSLLKNDFVYTATFGPVITYDITEETSVDFALAYTTALGSSDFANQIYAGIGCGYMITEEFQIVTELAGYACYNNEICSGKLSFFPGVTIDITHGFSFASGIQYDLIGKNEENSFGYFAAFTMAFN